MVHETNPLLLVVVGAAVDDKAPSQSWVTLQDFAHIFEVIHHGFLKGTMRQEDERANVDV
jgi:hypothetical protein